MFERLVVAVETIAASSGGRTAARPGVDERVELVLQAIQAFGNMVPTYAQLAEKTDIPASTLNGMKPVRDALKAARERVKSERQSGQSFKARRGHFEAWIDPEDTE